MIPWNKLPYEVQQSIVVEVVNDPDNPTSVSTLLNFLLLSHDVHDTLLGTPGRPHNDLFLVLFESRFDAAGPRRRLVSSEGLITPDHFAKAFKQRCTFLRDIKNGSWFRRISTEHSNSVERPKFERVLWEVYLMLLEDDGKNMVQLEHADAESWLRDVVLAFAKYETDNDGWPLDTTVLRLAAAAFAIISNRASVFREGRDTSREIIDILDPFLLGCHRYPHTLIPLTSWCDPQVRSPSSSAPESLPTMRSMPASEPFELVYFGHRLRLSPPAIVPSAVVIITNRQEQLPLYYSASIPATRAEADAQNFLGCTKADWIEINHLRKLAIGVETPRAGSEHENPGGLENPLKGSRRWDHVFNRMRAVAFILSYPTWHLSFDWFDVVYTPGMFTGYWLGRLVLPDARFVERMYAMHPASLSTVRDASATHELGVYVNFFQANFREHITSDNPVMCGEEDAGNGVLNGYFPAGFDPSKGQCMYETGLELVVHDPTETGEEAVKRYKTWNEGVEFPEPPRPPPLLAVNSSADSSADSPVSVPASVPKEVEMEFVQEGVGLETPFVDVIVTGETDYPHGKAFWPYMFYGRVRRLDGLLVLVRVSQDPDPDSGQGRWVFSGNMQLAGTIVGTWRDTSQGLNSPGQQAPFIISKLGPGFQPE